MSVAPASGGGDIRLEALNVECVGIVTLACTAVVWHVLGTHWEISGCRIGVANLACVFKLLLKERVEFGVNAQS